MAPTIQRIALAAQNTYMATANVPDVDCLAAMGTYGKDDQNIAMDLISKFCKGHDNIMPHPYIVSLPVQVKVHADCEKRMEFRNSHTFLPHRWFALLDAPDHIWSTLLESKA